MKIVISIFLFGIISFAYGQDSTKVKTPRLKGIKEISSNSETKFLRLSPNTKNKQEITIFGDFIVDKYAIQVKKKGSRKAKKIIGTDITINENLISGTKMDSVVFQIDKRILMNTEDYLFRAFGEVPETIPDDLPVNINVYKTDNLDCYGIARLSDGIILIPYNGLLLYLKIDEKEENE